MPARPGDAPGEGGHYLQPAPTPGATSPLLERVLLAIPTLNEAEGLPTVLTQARQLGVATVVADGGSTDGTCEVAHAFGVPVVPVSRGKGRGWRDLLASIPYQNWEYLAMVDGDASYDLLALPRLLATGADMAVGVRQPSQGSTSWLRALGARGLSLVAEWCTRCACPDLLSGFRVMRTACLHHIRLTADGFGLEAELTVAFLRRGFRVAWVPVAYRRRQGRSKLLPFRDGWDILLTILRTRYQRL